MAEFKPSLPYSTPMYLYKVVGTKDNKGHRQKVYGDTQLFFGSFKTYGGTESNNNGVVTVEDTANIETWYRPDITADCRVGLSDYPDRLYQIIGEPENINMRNQFLKFKVKRINGKA